MASATSEQKTTRIFILTLLAMIAFAANSLLCRSALRHTAIDAASFTFIRIFSGAIALGIIATTRNRWRRASLGATCAEQRERSESDPSLRQGSWLSALALFIYAAAFSFAYLSLSAGTGALLLFGAVQGTMILSGLRNGETLGIRQIFGLGLALGGLVALVSPGISAPPLTGSGLMVVAGVAWGIYSLRGKTARDPIAATAGNFLRAFPLAAVLTVALLPRLRFDGAGITSAVLSGAIASGFGYAIWYSALPDLRATTAATVQLSVPVLAAAAGIAVLGESLTLRFVFASIAVLSGIALIVTTPNRARNASEAAKTSLLDL